ncbi:hypothetical protein [Shewanella algae]
MKPSTVAIKIKTTSGNRYFCGLGKGKRIQTAWSIAGARLFLNNCSEDLEPITKLLEKKGKRFELVEVGAKSIIMAAVENRELTAELFAARAHIELLHDAINKGDLQTAQLAAGEFANDEAPFGIPGGDE